MKRYQIILMVVLIALGIILIIGISYRVLHSFSYCIDCVEGGWIMMDTNCGSTIQSKEKALDCFSSMSFITPYEPTLEEIEESYIRKGDYGLVEKGFDTIEVYFYGRWAIDPQGNMYVLAEGGG